MIHEKNKSANYLPLVLRPGVKVSSGRPFLNNHTLSGSTNGLPSIGVEPVVNAANGANNPGVEWFSARGSSSGNVLRGDNQRPSKFKLSYPQLVNEVREVEVYGAKKNASKPVGSDALNRLHFDQSSNKSTVFETFFDLFLNSQTLS